MNNCLMAYQPSWVIQCQSLPCRSTVVVNVIAQVEFKLSDVSHRTKLMLAPPPKYSDLY